MSTTYTDRVIAQALDKKVLVLTMEECAELIQAISKIYREVDSADARDNLIEEIADVLNCIEYIKINQQIAEEDIDKWREFKTERTINKWKEGTLK